MEEISLASSIAQIKAFSESPVWHDMVREVKAWLEDIRNQLEQNTDVEISRRLQGNAEACRYFIGLPDELISALEEHYGRPD